MQAYQAHLENLVTRRTRALAKRIEMERFVIEISSELIRLSEETYEEGLQKALAKIAGADQAAAEAQTSKSVPKKPAKSAATNLSPPAGTA